MSWRRRSAISPTSRSARSTRSPAPTSSPARTRASRAGCSTATASTRRSPPITSTAARARTDRLLDALARGQIGGARLRRRHAAHLRSGRSARRRCRRGRASRRADPGRVLARDGAFGGRAADRRRSVPRLPAVEERGAAKAPRERRSADRRDAGAFRIAEPHRARCSPMPSPSSAGRGRRRVCRELTKIHETFDRGTLAELAARYAERDVKGEIVLLVAPPADAPRSRTQADVDAALGEALRSDGREGGGASGGGSDRPFAPRPLPARAGAEGRRLTRRRDGARPPRRLSPRPSRRGRGGDAAAPRERAFARSPAATRRRSARST